MTGGKRGRRLQLGPVEVSVAVSEPAAKRIARSTVYRRLLRPAARWLGARPHQGDINPDQDIKPDRDINPDRKPPASITTAFELPRPSRKAQPLDAEGNAIWEKVKATSWYHSIDLGHGVVTPGFFDHRSQVSLYGLPKSLAGLRCLDVATFDGFWAFEMERRGASEVVALDVERFSDIDIPRLLRDSIIRLGADRETGVGFRIAHEILRSRVRYEVCNVYDLSPERLGTFDLVFLGDLLLHLRDPQLALERVFSVCRGALLVADVYNRALEDYGDLCLAQFLPWLPSYTWWLANTNTLKMLLTVAGFEPVEEVGRFLQKASVDETPVSKVVIRGSVPVLHSWKDVRVLKASIDEAVRGQPSGA
jgi:tRNA (mo5U34)-methyltransferase